MNLPATNLPPSFVTLEAYYMVWLDFHLSRDSTMPWARYRMEELYFKEEQKMLAIILNGETGLQFPSSTQDQMPLIPLPWHPCHIAARPVHWELCGREIKELTAARADPWEGHRGVEDLTWWEKETKKTDEEEALIGLIERECDWCSFGQIMSFTIGRSLGSFPATT